MNWKKLQNGSDIRGIALEGIEGEVVNLTSEIVGTIARSFVQWLKRQSDDPHLRIAVGTDSRLSGPALKEALIDGFVKSGVSVYDCGMASTPAMFMTTVHATNPMTAGIMITASHLPFNRNGLKFFTKNGGLDKKDISAILEIAETGVFDADLPHGGSNDLSHHLREDATHHVPHEVSVGSVEPWPFMDEYASILVDYIRRNASLADYDHPLKGMKIIVDAGNGAGGFFASKVLTPLGADTSGSQFLDPDGTFPNHIPNPEDAQAMYSICEAVKREQADLGIIFDTDVDRSAIVDKQGDPINRNALIALIASVVLREHPGSTIVTDSITSEGLTDFIKKDLKGKHHRFKRGYKNVINEAIRLNENGEESWLAIETSGHAALKENYFLDDGAYLVAKLLVGAARLNEKGLDLSSLIQRLRQPVESKEMRFSIACDDFSTYALSVLDDLQQEVTAIPGWEIVTPNYEGLRVRCTTPEASGWFLLRMSLHDPVMPLNIESDIAGGVQYITHKLMPLLKKYDGLKL